MRCMTEKMQEVARLVPPGGAFQGGPSKVFFPCGPSKVFPLAGIYPTKGSGWRRIWRTVRMTKVKCARAVRSQETG